LLAAAEASGGSVDVIFKEFMEIDKKIAIENYFGVADLSVECKGLVTTTLSTCTHGIQLILKMCTKMQLTIFGMIKWQVLMAINSYNWDK